MPGGFPDAQPNRCTGLPVAHRPVGQEGNAGCHLYLRLLVGAVKSYGPYGAAQVGVFRRGGPQVFGAEAKGTAPKIG
jgi:hypothetical protein